MTKKRLIVCADGTGNRGVYTPDSNVYKIYNAIDIHDDANPQIKFYDNGVGTSKNKFWRGLSGAFGFGFGHNVCDLYEFLARNYESGDDVFLFGFSRGAFTVRALAGMLHKCGLLEKGSNNLIPYASRVYRKGSPELAAGFKATFSRECKPHLPPGRAVRAGSSSPALVERRPK